MEVSDVCSEMSKLCGLEETWSPENLASMLKTFWRNLETKNSEDFGKRTEDKIPFMILSREIIDMVFCIGRRLNQAAEVQFITIEILDRFIISEIMAVWDWSRNTDCTKWERALLLVKKQFMLRLLCCMGIASKIDGNPGRVLKPKVLARYLSNNDRAISIRAVCLSEFHILKLIDYKAPLMSSLTYVNALCCLLSSLQPVLSPLTSAHVVSNMWKMCSRLLCLATVNHQRVYDNLAEFARRICGTAVSDDDLVAARCDRILLSAGVVALSAVFTSATDASSLLHSGEVSPGSDTLNVVTQMSSLTGVAQQDVEAMVAVLAHTTGLLDALRKQETQQNATTGSEAAAAARPPTPRRLTGSAQGININHCLVEAHMLAAMTKQENDTPQPSSAEMAEKNRNYDTPQPYAHSKNRFHPTHDNSKFGSPVWDLIDSSGAARIDSGIGTSHQTEGNPVRHREQQIVKGNPENTRAHKRKDRVKTAAGTLSSSHLHKKNKENNNYNHQAMLYEVPMQQHI